MKPWTCKSVNLKPSWHKKLKTQNWLLNSKTPKPQTLHSKTPKPEPQTSKLERPRKWTSKPWNLKPQNLKPDNLKPLNLDTLKRQNQPATCWTLKTEKSQEHKPSKSAWILKPENTKYQTSKPRNFKCQTSNIHIMSAPCDLQYQPNWA